MQIHESLNQCEEQRAPETHCQTRSGSPKLSLCKRTSIRNLLLEPDMEDLTSIWPITSDLKDLRCPDEEQHNDGAPDLIPQDAESRGECFSQSIFSSEVLSALPLTQAV